MKNKFKIITLFMSMMVIIAFSSCKALTENLTKACETLIEYLTKEYPASEPFTVIEITEGTLAVVYVKESKVAKTYYRVDEEIEKACSSEISKTGKYTVYQIQQVKYGGKDIEDYEIFEVEKNRKIKRGATLEDLKKSYEGFTAKLFVQNETGIYVFYDRNTITYTFQTGTEGKFEDGTIEKEVSGLYGATYTKPKVPTSTDYYFSKWLDSNGNVAPTSFGAENKTFGVSWKLKGKGGDEIPEGFVLVAGTRITGTESWTPSSSVFVSGRTLTILDLIVSDHEVTRGEYKDVMGRDPSYARAYDKDGNELEEDEALNTPVNNISWYDALVYCNKRSMTEGLTPCYSIKGSTDPKVWGEVPYSYEEPSRTTWNAATCDFNANGYRLPTEAEWEWLARGGENYEYAGSDTIDDVAWYEKSFTNDWGTRDVKIKAPNGYGLYDMSGNVDEWCWDWYGSINSSSASDGASSGISRVLRGGSWDSLYKSCRVADRDHNGPGGSYCDHGFRVVRSSSIFRITK